VSKPGEARPVTGRRCADSHAVKSAAVFFVIALFYLTGIY
jgi:hypothetical protein